MAAAGVRNETRRVKRFPYGAARSASVWLAIWLLASVSPAAAQEFTSNIQKRVNGALAMLQYSLAPDVTTSSLSVNAGEGGTNGLFITQLGGGATISKSFPLFLEGNAAYSRYDPVFILSEGAAQREVPVQWNSVAGTVGVGWDFPVAKDLVLRPIANFSLGRVSSDLSVAGTLIEGITGQEIEFLKHGRLDAYGYGGPLMLDYEFHSDPYEIDVEARLTNIWLESFGGTSEAVQGEALAQSFSLWTRWRAPTGLRVLDRPFRYVLEWAYSYYFGPDGDMLGYNSLNSLGAGIEFDTTDWWIPLVTRFRLIGRYRFGEDVRGYSVSLAISF
jgi:hypothetical protein